MLLGDIKKEGIKIYYRQHQDKRILFYLGVMASTLIYSLITGDWQLSLAGLMFSTITITLDGATTYESGGSEYNAIARLDDDKFVIAFRDINDSNKGKVIVGTRSGSTILIVLDDATIFETGDTDFLDIDVLDSTHFVIIYRDIDDGNKIKAIAGSVSGTTISLGSIVICSSIVNWGEKVVVIALDNTNFVLMYHTKIMGVRMALRVCSLSGTTITLGTERGNYPQAAILSFMTGDKLSSTKIVLGWGGYDAWVAVATVDTSAKTVTWGAVLHISTDWYNHISVSGLDDTYFVWTGAKDYGGHGNAVVCSVSGTTVTAGSLSTFNAANTTYISVASMDATHFIVAYRDEGNSNKGTVRGASKSGTTITWDADGEIEFESGDVTYVAICKMISNYFIIAFKDNG